MKIIAKYYINNYKLYTEDMKLVGQIRKNLTHAKQLSVLNASGEFFVQIEQKNDHIFLNYNDGSIEDTQLQYQQRTSLLQPPMAADTGYKMGRPEYNPDSPPRIRSITGASENRFSHPDDRNHKGDPCTG